MQLLRDKVVERSVVRPQTNHLINNGDLTRMDKRKIRDQLGRGKKKGEEKKKGRGRDVYKYNHTKFVNSIQQTHADARCLHIIV